MTSTLSFPSFTNKWHTEIYPAIDTTQNSALSFQEKRVVISGGGTGIGKETVKQFAAAGAAQIAILGRRIEKLEQTKERVESQYTQVKISVFGVDIADECAVHHAAGDIKKKFGPDGWDVFVANAGYAPAMDKVTDSKVDEWFRSFEINVKGNYLLAREFVPFAAGKEAVFIYVTSGAAHILPRSGHSAYCAAKLAATRMIEHFQLDCPNVRFTSVHPGVVETDMERVASDAVRKLPKDDVSLPAGFIIWTATREADFARARTLWANWDVGELKEREREIIEKNLLTTTVEGWATYMPDPNSEVFKGIMADLLDSGA